MLKTLGTHRDAALPVRLFEVSDVVLLAPEAEVGARNERRMVAAVCGHEATFEVIHGLLNRLMEALGVPLLGAHTLALSLPNETLVSTRLHLNSTGPLYRAHESITHARACMICPAIEQDHPVKSMALSSHRRSLVMECGLCGICTLHCEVASGLQPDACFLSTLMLHVCLRTLTVFCMCIFNL